MSIKPENHRADRLAQTVYAGDLLIRRMREGDVPGVMQIESVSFGKHHWQEDSFLNEMRNQMGRYYSLMLQRDGASMVAGYCGYWIILDEVHVTTVAVSPSLRGNALGELLLVHMLERIMGQTVHWVTLEVRVSNYSAQNLYYKYGFESIGVRPRYYQDNHEDALIMTTPSVGSPEFRTCFRQNKQLLIHRLGGLPEGFAG